MESGHCPGSTNDGGDIDMEAKLLKIAKALLAMFVIIGSFPGFATAASFYVSTGGSDTAVGTSSQPWATFQKAWSVLQPGDTLIVMNGTYHEAIAPTVSGTSANPITISAAYDGGAIIDMQGTGTGILIDSRKFLTIEGFLSINPGEASAVGISGPDGTTDATSNIILRKVGARGGSDCDNSNAFGIARAKDSLFEDVYSYGYGRYSLTIYGCSNITMRRAVIRWDHWDGTCYKPCDPRFSFGVYNTHSSVFENILLIDGNANGCGDNGAMLIAGNDNGNTAPYSDSDGNRFYNVISLNNLGISFSNWGGSGNGNNDNVFTDSVSWDSGYGVSADNAPGYRFSHTLIGHNGAAAWTDTPTTITNSLILDNDQGYSGSITVSYSNVYGNGGGDSAGSNGISQDPHLKYLTRLELGSAGKGTASDGGDRGADVVHQYIDGVKTQQPLWPWPHEKRIKQDLCDQAFLTEMGRTGAGAPKLCTTDKSITQYVWEYLGNPCPDEVCDITGASPICGDNICSSTENCSSCPSDCGACNAICTHAADINPCDGCISISEIQAYISQWRAGSIQLNTMMEAIRIWKEDC
jgi:hypothetical protein